ncbi:MAG: hypothetical protein B7C24_15035 [Bacteroidetes bacterium 4572_77]|nr:MAG: hypothetical protein B7C24_15035 [Bacteroidetes bacterium 4572_77]
MTNFKKIVKANLLKSILVFFVGCFALPAFAIIDISIKNSPNTTFYLQRIKGDRLFTLDSMQIVDGQIKFSWKAPYQAGMYRVYSGENSLYFLATEEDVILETKWPQLQGNLHIVQSKENEQWFSYLSLKKQTYQHLDLLNPIITWYDKDSDFYGIALQEFQKQQAAISLWIKDQKKDSTAYLAMQIIHSDIKPELPMGLSLEEQKEFFKEHWFAHVDWYDNDLINTNILTEKITEYLGLYADRNRSKAELQMAFKYAVDQLIPKVENNDEMYAFVLDYLLRGFERFNLEVLKDSILKK